MRLMRICGVWMWIRPDEGNREERGEVGVRMRKRKCRGGIYTH